MSHPSSIAALALAAELREVSDAIAALRVVLDRKVSESRFMPDVFAAYPDDCPFERAAELLIRMRAALLHEGTVRHYEALVKQAQAQAARE
jgi:hypothetical protein